MSGNPADGQRMLTKLKYRYILADRLSDRLQDMGKDLTGMINEINDASSNLSKNNKADDPVSSFV